MIVEEEPTRLQPSVAKRGRLGGSVAHRGQGTDIESIEAGRRLQPVARKRHEHQPPVQAECVEGFPFDESVLRQETGVPSFRRLAEVGLVGVKDERDVFCDLPANQEANAAEVQILLVTR